MIDIITANLRDNRRHFIKEFARPGPPNSTIDGYRIKSLMGAIIQQSFFIVKDKSLIRFAYTLDPLL